MAMRPSKLSATFVKQVAEPGRYGDGRGSHGLSLLVKAALDGGVTKSWSQRIRVDGKESNIGLGAYPIVTLARARVKALENRRAIEQGRDPRDRTGGIPTFERAADIVIELHKATWRDGAKSEAQWRASLRDYAFPKVGGKVVSEITSADVLAILMPIWNEKRETARRVRQRIGAVMKWAIAEGHRGDNPAGEAIGAALPKNGNHRKHQRALPHAAVGAALAKVRATGAYIMTRLAFEFVVLTASRSGEVRGMEWTELDLETATWTVPASRTKAGRDHRVPLSTRAVEVLTEAREYADGSGLVFPSARGRVMSDMTLSKLLKENDVGAVPHGFRSSFRDWCGETGVAREVAEACLAHVIENKAEAAYARTDLLDRRREVMQAWADYVTA